MCASSLRTCGISRLPSARRPNLGLSVSFVFLLRRFPWGSSSVFRAACVVLDPFKKHSPLIEGRVCAECQIHPDTSFCHAGGAGSIEGTCANEDALLCW